MPMILKVSMPYHGDISVNRYLAQRGKNTYTRDTAKIWGMVLKGSINAILPQSYSPDCLKEDRPFDMKISVFFPRRFSARSGDATNFDKFIRDVVATTLGIDDAGTSGSQDGTYGNGEDARIDIVVTLNTKEKTDFSRTLCLV